MCQGKFSSVRGAFSQLNPCFSARKERVMSQSRSLKNGGVAVLAMVVLLVAAVPLAQATFIADDFSNGTTDGDYFYNISPAGGSGWSGDWGATTSGQITSAAQHYTQFDLTSSLYNIAQTGNGYAQLTGRTDGNWRGINRYAQTPLSGTVWFSFLEKNLDTGYGCVQLNNHAGPPYADIDYGRGNFEVGNNGGQLEVRWGGSGNYDTAPGDALSIGDTHLIIGKITIGAGNDSIQVWADPTNLGDLNGSAKAQLSVGGADLGDSLTMIGFGGINGVTKFDALRFSDGANAFADVTGVPEPSTIVLLATGIVGLLAYAWRRRR